MALLARYPGVLSKPGERTVRGAYGMSLSGLGADYPCLPVAPDSWPHWDIRWVDVATHVATGPTLGVNVGGYLELRPDDRQCIIATSEPPSTAALAHPWLATIGAWVANGRGCESFHGGGVVIGGRLWVVLGPKEAGKSTTLAALGQAGCTVTSDDLVVLDGDTSLSGPACVDLRQGSAEGLQLGTRTALMAGRERWRVELPPPPAQVPLAGFVLPAWGPVSVQPVPAADRLRLLFDSRAALWRDDRGLRMLGLAGLPVLCWRRPHSLSDLHRNVAALVERLQDD